MMALRLARLATAKPKFLRFRGHFHGWHDAVTISSDPPYDAPGVPGVTDGTAGGVVAIPPNDLNAVEEALTANPDIGVVILEPTGGHWGAVPIRGAFLMGLRELCTRRGVLLIFDEVITGFRVAPWRAGFLRRHARPRHVRQDSRRRSCRGVASLAARTSWRSSSRGRASQR